jgi:uncharacterized protein (TIGR04168 family)
MTSFRIGVVGDLHTYWDEVDVGQFDRSNYDLLYFTGDLGGGSRDSSLRVARVISRLRKQALVMPGNNDTGDIAELGAELAHRAGLKRLSAIRQGADDDDAGPNAGIRLCGYSNHRIMRGPVDVTVIAARPHSMGGQVLSFAEHMAATYGIDSMEMSTERLLSLVDATETTDLMFFSHNGPTGLGGEPHDMWGCDFKPGGGDWGDPDLAAAITYARAGGKRVLAVVAGHMHLRTKGGDERPWRLERDGVTYVNAARVPRIFPGEDDVHRHHVALTLTADGVDAEEVMVPQFGS